MARRKLTPHFSPQEFYCHDGTRWPLRCRQELVKLCRRYLEPLREHYGPIQVVSGYRHREYNRRVGGASDSRHIYLDQPGRGVAADVRPARGTAREWYEFLDELGVGGLGLYDSTVHADTRDGRARWDSTS